MKTFVTLFYLGLRNIHLTKDVWLVPYYMHKLFWYKAKIVTPKQSWEREIYEDLEKYTDWLSIETTKGKKIGFIDFGLIRYLIKNSRKIDILHIFHFSLPTLLYWVIYKLCNRRGILYLKMDLDIRQFKNQGNKIYDFWSKLVNDLAKPIENLLIHVCDIISIEVEEGVDLLSKYNKRFKKKLIRIPNGADDINIDKIVKKIKGPTEKENIIIATMGRIWTRQKNTEMLLEIIKNMNLKDRRIKIIWPIEKYFLPKIEDFFREYPEFKETVEFTGSKNKKEVYEYYNKAKIFILTSRWEGFAIVYPESLYFGNYIITTDVSGAQDITKKWTIWDVVPIEDIKIFTNRLQHIMNDKQKLVNVYEKTINYSRNIFTWSKIIKKLEKSFIYLYTINEKT